MYYHPRVILDPSFPLSLTPHPIHQKQCRRRASSAAVLVTPGWNPLASHGLTKETILVVVEETEHLWTLGREQIPRPIYLKSFPQQRQRKNSTRSVRFE